MDNQPVTTRRAILIQDFDDADIYAVVLTDGTCASSPTQPEADGGLVTFGLFDGGAMTVPLDFIRYVRVMPRVDDRGMLEWPSTEKEEEDIER